MLRYSTNPDAKDDDGSPVDTSRIDFRKVRGFEGALRRALVKLGFESASDAEVRSVDDKASFLRAVQAAGARQVIYFGHAYGSAGIAPGGLGARLVRDADLAKALGPRAPRPILIGCHSGDVARVGDKRVGIGPARDVVWTKTFGPLAKDHGLQTQDVSVSAIELVTVGMLEAPAAPLRPYEPRGPE